MNLDKFFYDSYQELETLQKENRVSEAKYCAEAFAVHALNTLGLLYVSKLNNYDKALKCFDLATDLDPGNWILWSNKTHLFCTNGKYSEAAETSEKSILYSQGKTFDVFYNGGVIQSILENFEKAENFYKKSMELNPEHYSTKFNLSLLLLKNKKFKEGWSLYNTRYLVDPYIGSFAKRFIQEEWDGRKFKNKTLCVYSEQGLGDFLHFCRFLPNVTKLGGKVICEVQASLAKIIKDNFDVEVISRDTNGAWPKAPMTDYAISVSDLARVLKIHDVSQFSGKPYLTNFPKKPKENNGKKKIGINWAGSSDHKKDNLRSIKISSFSEILQNPNFEIYSLVKGVQAVRRWNDIVVNLNEGIENFNLIDETNGVQDFSDMASLIAGLDCIVTVDTGLIHLAGAVGVKSYLLLGPEHDWRWFTAGDTTPWYDSVEIIRYQDSWERTISELTKRLNKNYDP